MGEWDIAELEWDFSWLDKMDKTCPFCKAELTIKKGETDPGVASAYCTCGYSSTFTPPDDLDPFKGTPIEIVI